MVLSDYQKQYIVSSGIIYKNTQLSVESVLNLTTIFYHRSGKMQREYKLYTLNGRELVKMCEDERYARSFDLNSGYIRSKLIRAGQEKDMYYSSSALLDQIMLTLDEVWPDGCAPNSEITKHLVILDFGKLGVKNYESETELLVNEGFSLCFPGEAKYIHFTPFEKSASMSRNNVISFIDENLFERVDKRLGLGLDWTSIRLVPSKYYAYRGLYLTDGERINHDSFILNEKTVLILKGGKDPNGSTKSYRRLRLENVDYITVKSNGDDNAIPVSKDNIKIKENGSFDITTYDGEGFISPEYALKIRTCLAEDNVGERSTSFQIRMPFSKGMLHEVKFKDFFRNEFPEDSIEDLEIEDFFGIKRKLKDVEIILTDSMFKCGKWLSKFNEQEQLILSDGSVTKDPVKYFFDKMVEFNHAMYIVSTNRNIRSKRQIRMSYQFLNTLDMERREFETMIRGHMREISLLRRDPETAINALLGNITESSIDPDEEDDAITRKLETWEYALSINPAFLNDPKVIKEIKNIEKSRTKGIMEGKIYIDGTIKYLSMDLLGLLLEIADECGVKHKEKINEWKKTKKIYRDSFYLSGWKGYGLQKDKYYGILRNPHLSRNEQCALRPFNSPIYNKYFGDLKGVIMTGYESEVPTALAGADFDGDMVKIVFNEAVNDAILKAVYTKDGTSPKTGIQKYRRKVPISLIDPPQGADKDKKIGKKIEIKTEEGVSEKRIYITFEDIKSTFSSRVGQISNLAIDIGRMEYHDGGVPDGSTALCTIATGLEIDSVKTGISPDLTYLEGLIKSDESGFMTAIKKYKRILEDNEKNNKTIYGRFAYKKYQRFKKIKPSLYKCSIKRIKHIDKQCNVTRGIKKYKKNNIKELRYRKSALKNKDRHFVIVRGRVRSCETYLKYKNKNDEIIFSLEGKPSINIDNLPYFYAEQLIRRTEIRGVEYKDVPEYRFVFEKSKSEEEWRKEAAVDPRSAVLRGYVGAYRKLLANTVRFGSKDISYQGHVIRLMQVEYNLEEDLLPLSGKDIFETVNMAYEQVYNFLPKREDVNDAIKTMQKLKWEFVPNYDKRIEVLKNILDTREMSPEVVELLCDSYDNGYQILNYVLRDVQAIRHKEEQEELPPEDKRSRWKRYCDEDFYKELYNSYYMSHKSRSVMSKEAGNYCREEVLKLFGHKNVEDAVKCTLGLDKGSDKLDENHDFLWDVYTIEDIKDLIYREKESQNAQ